MDPDNRSGAGDDGNRPGPVDSTYSGGTDVTEAIAALTPARTTPKAQRGKGEGSVFRRADGTWEARAEAGLDAMGRRRRIIRKGRTKAEAVRKLREVQRQLDAGNVPNMTRTVADYLTWWVAEVAPVRVKPTTVAQYRYVVEHHLVPRLGRHKLGALTPADVQVMIGDLIAEGKSPHTVRQVVGVLSGAIRYAMRTGLVGRNVCSLVDLPRVAPRTDDDTLTPEEVRRLLAVAKGDRWEPFLVLALGYGFRQGELLALRWADVNLDGSTATVRVSATLKWPAGGGWVLTDPKTAGSLRVIELDPATASILKAHRRRQAEDRLAAGETWADHGFVFATADGEPIQDRNALRRWHTLLAKAKLDRRPFHAARRTAITNMAERGVPLEVAASIVGHASIRMTAEVYNRVRPRGRIEAAGLIGAVLHG